MAAAGASIVGSQSIGRDKASARVGGKRKKGFIVNPLLGTYTYGFAYAYVPAFVLGVTDRYLSYWISLNYWILDQTRYTSLLATDAADTIGGAYGTSKESGTGYTHLGMNKH